MGIWGRRFLPSEVVTDELPGQLVPHIYAIEMLYENKTSVRFVTPSVWGKMTNCTALASSGPNRPHIPCK